MDAKQKLGEYFEKLDEEYNRCNAGLMQQGTQIDSNRDANARMIVLRMHAETAFTSAFSLIKTVMRLMGGPLAMIESLEKDLAVLQKKEEKNESIVAKLQADNVDFKRNFAALTKELSDLKRRVDSLESRPPGGGSPPSQTSRLSR